MAIRDYWIYQKRQVQIPWALYIVKEYDKRYPEIITLDYTLYHEDISNSAHSVSKVGLHFETISAYVDDILATLTDNAASAEFTSEDYKQLEKEIYFIMQDRV